MCLCTKSFNHIIIKNNNIEDYLVRKKVLKSGLQRSVTTCNWSCGTPSPHNSKSLTESDLSNLFKRLVEISLSGTE